MFRASAYHILFVDDDNDILFAGAFLLRQAGYKVSTLSNPELLLAELQKSKFDLVFLDMNFKGSNSGNEGLFWLRAIKKIEPELPVIMLTAYGAIELAVSSIKDGASDFLSKPWDNEKLLNTVKASLKKSLKPHKSKIQSQSNNENIFETFIGNSENIQAIKRTIEKAAPTDASVLILGENGTGKEVIAQILHKLSKRGKHNFVSIDMGAIPESLIESELFGHKKGSFTDAKEDRMGRFELADKGTLFLDEIGNISLNTQAKLLHALQEKTITRLGSNEEVQLDLRVISATNVKLNQKVKSNEFRQDLLYRLNTLIIELPPLRERVEDISLLTEHFIQFFADKYDRRIRGIEPIALQKLKSYSWPGNIRELQHVIERAIILSDETQIRAHDLILETPIHIEKSEVSSDNKTLENLEKETISQTLTKHNYTISKVADELGLSRAALYRRMEKYGL